MDPIFLTEDERKFQTDFKAHVAEHIAPHAADIDKNDDVPQSVYDALSQPPFPVTAMSFPTEYGGKGLAEVYACMAVEEIGRVCPALVPYIEVNQLFGTAIEIAGTQEQKKKYLGLVSEGRTGAYALTDETAGSDPVNMTTFAKKEGDVWKINGKKRHITYFNICDAMALFCRTSEEAGPKGLSVFMIDNPRDVPAIRMERHSQWIGLRGHIAHDLIIEDLELPDSALIGGVGDGLKIALKVLNKTRISLAAGHAGLARIALEEAIDFAKERISGGKPIWQYQSIGFRLVEQLTRVDAARLLVLKAARLHDSGANHRLETAQAKLFSAEALAAAVDAASRTLGGFGGHLDYATERRLRDGYSWIAAQGTAEVQKIVAGREIFK